jgi:mTERF domain-containing protein
VKVQNLENTFRLSGAEAGIAVPKARDMLTKSKDMLQRKLDFLISEVGLEPTYIAYRPVLLTYSLEAWLGPPLLYREVSQGKWIGQA